MPPNSTKARVVVITGCSSGFGRQMVTQFLEDGWLVIATLRKAQERRHIFNADLERFGRRLHVVECDVTLANHRKDVREAVERLPHGLHCLINNAGFMLLGALEDTSEHQLRAQFETNFIGSVLLTKELLPHLRATHGTIINVSSVFGFATWPLTSVYCASKFALEGFTQSLRQELSRFGVRVALLEPGSEPTALMDNLQWGEQMGSESVYSRETQGYQTFRNGLRGRKRDHRSRVAREAVRIANARNPRFHNPVGIGSRTTYCLARLFPAFFGVRFMAWLARRSFTNKHRSVCE